MIDDTMAERMVACGWLAASANALLILVGMAIVLIQTHSLLLLAYLIDVGLLVALAYGIYRRSRICAIGALAHFLLSTASLFDPATAPPFMQQAIGMTPGLMAKTLFFTTLYVLGVIGTFVHHARLRSPAA